MPVGDALKGDGHKPDMRLIVPGWIWETGQVMTHGATKYFPGGWMQVEPWRYHSALYRHYLAHRAGERYDEETGLHHMAHVACNAMFLWYFDEGESIPKRRCLCEHCQPKRQVPEAYLMQGCGL